MAPTIWILPSMSGSTDAPEEPEADPSAAADSRDFERAFAPPIAVRLLPAPKPDEETELVSEFRRDEFLDLVTAAIIDIIGD